MWPLATKSRRMAQRRRFLNKPAIPAFVTARMSSHRLPGKALRTLGDQTLLGHTVNAVAACQELADVYVVTSTDESDDAITEWGQVNKVKVIRGSLHDVAGRLLLAAQELGVGGFVRISADSPFIDPLIIGEALALYEAGSIDLVTNVCPRSFPRGQSVEIVSTSSLEQLCAQALSDSEKEHVTTGFYHRKNDFVIRNFSLWDSEQASEYLIRLSRANLCVDDLADFLCASKILQALGGSQPWQVGWRQCAEHQCCGCGSNAWEKHKHDRD